MEATLTLVYRQLDNDLNENALFILDRLQARDLDNASLMHLRSLCCLRLGRFASACEYSRELGLSGEHAGCSYVFAQSCFHQKLYADGITALEQAQRYCSGLGLGDEKSRTERFAPDVASINRLLGKLYKANGDLKSAANCLIAALEADPFMWDAFTDLSDSGIQLKVSNVFKLRPAISAKERYTPYSPASTHGNASLPARDDTGETHITTPAGRFRCRTRGAVLKPQPALGMSLPSKRKQRPALDIIMPEGGRVRADVGRKENTGPTFLVMSQRRSARLNSATSSATSATVTDRSIQESTVKGDAFKRLDKQRAMLHPISRKTSILERRVNSAQSSVTSTSRDSKSTASPTPTSRTVDTDHVGPELPPAATDQSNLQMLIQLFLKLGTAYYNLRRFQPQACLDALVTLPVEQQATAWVISKTARCQYEKLSYKDAKSTFRVLRKIAPTWMEDLELYSTVLWHLNDDVSLAFHAHELIDSHFLSPETWCAMGNSFSLQKAYSDAIKCFQRATQLQPQLPQSYSLLGHAHHDAEQYDEASTAFRRALQVDRRHYTAWVGLGRVQEKLGRLETALKHYRNAEKINPTNGVLLTHIARVLDKLGNSKLGLTYVQRAAQLDLPEKLVAFAKLQSATLFLRLGSPREAMRELRLAQEIAPNEPDIHFMLGKAHLMSGNNKGAALKCFTIALSLSPGSEAIKGAMESLEDDE